MGIKRSTFLTGFLILAFALTLGFAFEDVFAQSVKQVEVQEKRMVTLIGEGLDFDNDDLTYLWKQLDGEPVVLSSYTVKEPTFLAPAVANGKVKILTFSFTVTDPFGASDTDTIQIIVRPVNEPPVADAGPDRVIFPSVTTITFLGGCSDPDGDKLTFSWKQLNGEPVRLYYASSKHLTIYSSFEQIFDIDEPLEFQMTCRDGNGGSDTDTALIYPFGWAKRSSDITVEAGPLQVVPEGSTVTLQGSGSNSKNIPMTFVWKQNIGPAVTLSSNTNLNPQFVAPSLEGNDHILVSFLLTGHAKDLGTATDLTIVKVVGSNRAPTADAGPDQSVNENTKVTLRGSGSDPDGDPIKYEWRQVAGESVILATKTDKTPSFKTPDLANGETRTYTFELKVTDPYGLSGTDQVTIDVAAVNRAPYANAGPDQTVQEKTQVKLAGSGNDPDGDLITYSWRQLSGEPVQLSSTTIPNPTFSGIDVPSRQTHIMNFELTVTDPYQLSNSDRVTIRVVSVNAPPTANAGPDVSVNENTKVNLACQGNDADGDAITYAWRQVSGEQVAIMMPSSQNISITTPKTMTQGQLVFQCTVSDGISAGTDTVIVNYRHVITTPVVADAGPDQIVNEQVRIQLDGSKSHDPENLPLAYQWTQISGEEVTLSSDSVVNPTFTSPTVANYQVKVLEFELRVYDLQGGREATDTVKITVDPINAAPEAIANARQS